MPHVQLRLKENSYRIFIGNHILPKLGAALKGLNLGRDAVIITNPAIYRRHGTAIAAGLKKNGFSVKVFSVPDGEKSKSAKEAFNLLGRIAAYDVKRKVFVIAFGGGVVGDLAGYVAAAYKRGIPYVQVPTTLLAQLDSAIGGKVAIDLPMGKNLVGAFHQPRLVWSDVAVLRTLDNRQIRNGLSEAVKYGVICDKKLFAYIGKNYKKLLAHDPKALEHVISVCCQIKARVVSLDEKETLGIRTFLNFGHTVGHAIETASNYGHYQHGEAVAVGMRVAAELSYQLGLLSGANVLRLEELLKNIGLPVRFKKVSPAAIIKTLEHDKKFKGGKNRFVLASDIGHVQVISGVPANLIKQSIQNCIAR